MPLPCLATTLVPLPRRLPLSVVATLAPLPRRLPASTRRPLPLRSTPPPPPPNRRPLPPRSLLASPRPLLALLLLPLPAAAARSALWPVAWWPLGVGWGAHGPASAAECTSGCMPTLYRESSFIRLMMLNLYLWPLRVFMMAK